MLNSWYAIHTLSQHEQKVSRMLQRQAAVEGLWDREIFEILIPTEEGIRTRDGKRTSVEKKVFPGYILVRMILSDDSMHLVKRISGVTGFVSSGTKPVPIEDTEIQSILERIEKSRDRPRTAWVQGDTVRVIEGPFVDFTGKIEEVIPEREKLKVLITIFGRDTPVELDFDNVEKA